MTVSKSMIKLNKFRAAFIYMSLFASTSVCANTNEQQALLPSNHNHAETAKEDYSGGYLKVGYGYKSEISPYHDEDKGGALFLSGRYQWELGFFIETSHGANELDQGTNVGFNFYNTDNWHFDVLTATAHGSNEYVYRTPSTVQKDELSSTTMLGLRASGSLKNTQLQFIVTPYSFNSDYDDGIYASAWASKAWQIKNWELYASAGLEYRSEEILDYYYSTTELQKQIGLPDYKASGGMDAIFQVGASYPVAEDVLFETYYRYTNVSDSIIDSPIMSIIHNIPGRSADIKEFGAVLSYVF